MGKTRKILSLILCVAMIFTTLGALAPSAFAAEFDGSNKQLSGKTELGFTIENGVAGVFGKLSTDTVYKVSTQTQGWADKYILNTPYLSGITKDQKAMISFDILFASEDAGFGIAAGLWSTEAVYDGEADSSWSLDSNANRYYTNNGGLLTVSAKKGLVFGTDHVESAPANAPTSLSLNEWHNVCLIVDNNGTKNVTAYLDGVKYTTNLKFPSYGVRHMRTWLEGGTIYLDNIDGIKGADISYDETAYARPSVSVATSDDFEYDADTKTITVESSVATVADLKNIITTTGTIRVYDDNTYKTTLGDEETPVNGAKIVIESANGVFSYLNVSANDSIGAVNETGINTGSTAVSIANPKTDYKVYKDETLKTVVSDVYFFETTSSAGNAGVYGKTADDKVIKVNTKGSNAGFNFIAANVYKERMSIEFQVLADDVFKFGMQMGYFKDSTQQDPNFENPAFTFQFKDNKLYDGITNTSVADTPKARWYTISFVTPKIGEKSGAYYVNGVKYAYELKEPYYGARHIRLYSDKGTKLDIKVTEDGYYYQDYPTYNWYIDNLRAGKLADTGYKAAWDKPATLSSNDSSVRVVDGNIAYDNTKTVAELKENLKLSAEDAAVRFYSDSTCTTELSANDTIGADAVAVVAAKNGFSFERVLSYYTINDPHINTTIFNYELKEDGTAKVTGFKEENIVPTDDITAINIPETIAGYTVTEIADSAFYAKDLTYLAHQIQSVVLPSTVKKIGNYAFAGCKWSDRTDNLAGSLKSVQLNEGLEEIGQQAFGVQSNLENVNFPSTLKSLGVNSFYWTNIKEVSLPDSVTYLGSGAFSLCWKLKYVKLSAGLTEIPEALFRSSTSIDTFVIPSSIEKEATASCFAYGSADPGKPSIATVYGASDSYAKTFATKYGYDFVPLVANMIVSNNELLGDGTKTLNGSSYDLDSKFKSITFNVRMLNVGKEEIETKVSLALYNENGKMLKSDTKEYKVAAGNEVQVTNDNGPKIETSEIKDGYTVKGFIWRKGNNEPIADATEIEFDKDNIEIHVLTLANSFCNDSFRYMQEIAKAGDVTIKTVNMYSGGAPLKTHWTNITTNGKYSNTVVNGNYLTAQGVVDEIKSDRWDYVALQCATHGYSQDKDFLDYNNETTKKYYEEITAKVAEYAPTATRVMHMSWGPDNAQSKVMLKQVLNLDVEESVARGTLYEKQKEAYKYGASIFATDKKSMVPTSVAVQYAIEKLGIKEHGFIDPNDPTVTVGGSEPKYQPKDSDGNPAMYRDATCHMTNPYGSILVGLTWYEFLTGKDARENPYQSSEVNDPQVMAKLKEAAHFANQHPDWTFGADVND